jgi:hypothetical protein
MIRIEKQAPHLVKTKMICDNGLADKLNNFEVLKHLNQHSTTLLVGKPRSGKTSLITSLFSSRECMKKVFHKVYIFQPASSGASVKNNVFDKLPPEQIFNELTIEDLNQVYNDIQALPKDYNKCIILDDQGSYLKNKELQRLFKNLCFNRRHLGVSIYFLTQTYFSVPRELRKIFNNLFIFKTSKMELQTIFEEQIELDKSYVLPISKLVLINCITFSSLTQTAKHYIATLIE